MEIDNEANNKYLYSLEDSLREFFKSLRVKTYFNRLRISSIFLILFATIQSVIWVKLEFINILFDNFLIVMCGSVLTLLANFIFLFKISQISGKFEIGIIKKINFLFNLSFFNFVVNLVENLFTLFGAYLTYFESNFLILLRVLELSEEYSDKFGNFITFLLIFLIFLVIVVSSCISIYFFLMTSKFCSYVKVSANFGIFDIYKYEDQEKKLREEEIDNTICERE